MTCPTCNNTPAKKFEKDRNGLQRFRCNTCKKTFLEPHRRPLDDMRLPIEKAVSVIHLGQRNREDTVAFTEKLAHATEGNFQITTDAFPAYKDAIIQSLGAQHVDFAQVITIYRATPESETRYSPSVCIGCEKLTAFGNPVWVRLRLRTLRDRILPCGWECAE